MALPHAAAGRGGRHCGAKRSREQGLRLGQGRGGDRRPPLGDVHLPGQQDGSYLLPVKKAVRDKARIRAGDAVDVRLELQPDDVPRDKS
nr:DUF1905 domain-containing protein [Arthrobacter nitrophenolicus]